MYTIENTIDIAAPLPTVLTAVSTKEGFRGWWTLDTECDADKREATFSFRKQGHGMSATFKLDHLDDRSIAMTCIREVNNADWLGTTLAISLSPSAAGTQVRLVHSGYRAKNEVYEQCTKGWAFFLGSLAKYATTGIGEPHVVKAA